MAATRTAPGVVLAKAVAALPAPASMPGGTRMEPKWDGIRMTAVRTIEGAVTVWSRHGTDMTEVFPEIAEALSEQLPEGVVVDGEIVSWKDGRLDFDVLLQRISTRGAKARHLARSAPASLVLFDLLEVADRDIRHHPFDVRRTLLEELAQGWSPPLSLSPITRDVDEAQGWMEDLAVAGIEGVVVKGGAQPYRPGERDWLKVKRRDTVDVVVGAVIGSISRPQELVVGLLVDGQLRIAGRSTPLKPSTARSVGALLEAPAGEHPWPDVVKPGALDRFGTRRDPVKLTLVEPVMAEVSVDVARTGYSFRHAVRFVRLRPDLPVVVGGPDS